VDGSRASSVRVLVVAIRLFVEEPPTNTPGTTG
jgi:hypothetical protein